MVKNDSWIVTSKRVYMKGKYDLWNVTNVKVFKIIHHVDCNQGKNVLGKV